jgi:hypothetical protein
MFYLILALPFILFFSQIMVTNWLVPYFKKKELYNQLKNSSDWPRLEKIENIIDNLFVGTYAKFTSIKHRIMHFNTDKQFIYGEIDCLAFYSILKKAQVVEGDVFYDLGSGSGKAVFAASLYFDLSKACGIEFVKPLHQMAQERLSMALQRYHNAADEEEKIYFRQLESIRFINNNFLEYDFFDATVLYVAATCLNDVTWKRLIDKMSLLKTGSRIIVTSKSIDHEGFDLIYQGIDLMSWGLSPVSIYERNQYTRTLDSI